MATIVCRNRRPQMATVRYNVMKRAEKVPGHRGEVITLDFNLENIRDRVKVRKFVKEEAG